ncbi:DNA polymerase III subunit epsilon [Methylorubrum populi]|nr:DNA polymerase III subunit epsilon [Methylorubrum populi]
MIYSQRIVVGDTETTGTDPKGGDRIIEVGFVEIVNGFRTGRHFHSYVNPERPVPADATAIHGITDEMLKDAPVFAAVAADIVEFIADSPAIFHNAPFDLGFFDLEFGLLSLPSLDRSRVTDSLVHARKLLPAGAKAGLDALCNRYGIDRTRRTKHGALMDSELLADVWLAMTGTGGLAHGFGPAAQAEESAAVGRVPIRRHAPEVAASLLRLVPSDHEAERHSSFVATQLVKPLWKAETAEASRAPSP